MAKITFKLERDWPVIFLIFGALLAVMLVLSPRPAGGTTLVETLTVVCIAVNGLYGGYRGRGEGSNAKDNSRNTFGLPAGLIRGLVGGLYLILAFWVGLYMFQSATGLFLLAIGFELLGLAAPGIFAGRK
ncbi:MAG: hypothetical protein ACFFCD_00015 [Promethearchaeota archaeon]